MRVEIRGTDLYVAAGDLLEIYSDQVKLTRLIYSSEQNWPPLKPFVFSRDKKVVIRYKAALVTPSPTSLRVSYFVVERGSQY